MKKICYLKEEKGRKIKAVKIFLYEKNGHMCGRLDLSAFEKESSESGFETVVIFLDRSRQEIGYLDLSREMVKKRTLFLHGNGPLGEELSAKLAMQAEEFELTVRIGNHQYLPMTEKGEEKQEAQELTTEDMEQADMAQAEEMAEDVPKEMPGKRIIQLAVLEEDMIFRSFLHNSFLIHGFYNYGHLVLDETGEQVRLGVPGNYYEREQMVAQMFGFPDFEPARETENVMNGTFGYFYTKPQ